jgi:hypothetical protein
VARWIYPPENFACLYRHNCPYLDGMSTQWVLEEYRQAEEVYQEHLRIIEGFDGELKVRDERIRVLERQNAELKAKLQAWHRRQFKSNKKRGVPTEDTDVDQRGEEEKTRGAIGASRMGAAPTRPD